MDRHAWYFRGLEPSSNAWNSTTPAAILKDRVPTYIQELFEQQLGGRGFALQELAVLAATLEHLVNNEAQQQLEETFKLLGFPLEGKLSKDQFDDVLDTYLLAQILKANLTMATKEQLPQLQSRIKDVLPEWPEAQVFVRDIIVKFGYGMDFAAALQVVIETSKQLGVWHKGRCQRTKDRLTSLGDRQIGRIQLPSFYTDSLARFDQQGGRRPEHIDYLRELGALDESVAQRPKLLVANYINSRSNCFATSSFYMVCCANECEGLLRHLEWEIGAPLVEPDHIKRLVSNLPSATVGAPRELRAPLIKRLVEIADYHGGQVPIHGRLFAQWLHHAYPRECPYPHSAGKTRPQTADEWMVSKGRDAAHTREEIQAHVDSAVEQEVDFDADVELTDELPWSDDEELLVKHAPCGLPVQASATNEVPQRPFNFARFFVGALAILAMFWVVKDKYSGTIRTLRTAICAGIKPPMIDKEQWHQSLA
jgi:hypothetical protein